MSHARIEEVSDDSSVSDPSEVDIDDFAESDIIRSIPSKPSSQSTPSTTTTSHPSEPPLFPPPQQAQQAQQQQQQQIQADQIKEYQMLYPVYFDASRTRAEGRRVSSKLAVSNPLAREIANACATLRLSPVLEAHRVHPKDWSNPGRVRVNLKAAVSKGHPVKNKHHLYVVVAKFLQEHPTSEDPGEGGISTLRHGVRGMNLGSLGGANDIYADGKPWPRPAVPRGWKMSELLPAYSSAMTGGGVSENAFKDMMREMQNQGGPGGGGMPGLPGGMNPDMMNMLANMGGGGGGMGMGGPSAASDSGGKKGKKGKGK
ncbi:signal recognition particle, SRP19 subunit [Xylariaceae sp. FL0255]|nr:signal recognition particle, SRP19 subunit [Xylariaceae sp. FL0255]